MLLLLLVLVLLLLLLSSSVYAMGFIPGTGRHLLKEMNVSKLSLEKIDNSCNLMRKWKKSFDRDEMYFTLGGMKPIKDFYSDSDGEKFGEFWHKNCIKMTPQEAEDSFIDISDTSRPYPPKPYPGASGGDITKNEYSWKVENTDYGYGTYTVKANSSLLINDEWNGVLDAEGLFNVGTKSLASYDETRDSHAYHSVAGGAPSSFTFTLPVHINLTSIEIFPRSYSNTEVDEMLSSWTIEGIDRSVVTTEEPNGTQELLLNEGNVKFEYEKKKSLKITTPNKYNEFRVTMDPVGTTYMVFNDILFYGVGA